ncbi:MULTISPECIES: very short patch repair endonuclease [unclassified Mesorhizobium]|uniref:very short patch repair endonuclease n=1 Tax=unclassified Mesorhizobium TaxID=325217 RepID=UPI00112717E3|nr:MULTISPECIES: very short patch repair endonuclease [unclassified Mesorhizobium]MBZ9998527.1 very short patch repair endonuclease [Mesorhizobium sp. B264B2A]MCA0005072.1 very short patch repair endonuclease [Mesorhizobium sp. B264B1B]MCA0019748.1 very short patch repair endonuclease [Mesorhizobium sp. B264B1A]TPJ45680.1 DNA mismatch endonuclease Vsr [Mesorhizobium sp. B2-6-6]
MPDPLAPEKRSKIMRAIRAKNTKPERAVRKLLNALGYRFRIHPRHLPGKPDIAFTKRKKAIFIHGCFWHQHPDPACRDAQVPSSNTGYWVPKLSRTKERDAENEHALRQEGWDLLILWECELHEGETLEKRLLQFLGPLRWPA